MRKKPPRGEKRNGHDPGQSEFGIIWQLGAHPFRLRAGDVISKLGPAPTPDAGALLSALAAADPGQRVELTITRSGQERTVSVTLGTLPATRP